MYFRSVDEQTEETLIEKCQQNGWLMHGGYDWQDDPYLEEYPYEFCVADRLEELRSFFAHGNWAIRQGIVFKDLAFIQQINGGDEWWTLKQTDEGWLDFESISFEHTIKDPDSFDHLVYSMVIASPELCRKLDYEVPKDLTEKIVQLANERGYFIEAKKHLNEDDLKMHAIRSIFELPEKVQDWALSIAIKNDDQIALEVAEELSERSGRRVWQADTMERRVCDFFFSEKQKAETLSDKATRAKDALAHQTNQSVVQRNDRDK